MNQSLSPEVREEAQWATKVLQYLIDNSVTVQSLYVAELTVRRIQKVLQQQTMVELQHGWDGVENVPLLMQIRELTIDGAAEKDLNPLELRKLVLELLLPVLDIMCLQAIGQLEGKNDVEDKTVSGDDHVSEGKLGELSDGGAGDAEHQAGECGQGSGSQAGGEGGERALPAAGGDCLDVCDSGSARE